MSGATTLLLPGNMCDARLWAGEVRGVLDHPIDVDLSQADSIEAMAERSLRSVDGPILPIGFSMGAIVALAIANRAPERLAGLALLDVNPAADLPERAVVRPRQQADVESGQLLNVVVEELKPKYLARDNCSDRRLLDLLRDMAMALGPATFVRQSEALRTRGSYSHVVAELGCPVFVACGAEDRLCLPEWHQDLATQACRPTLHIFSGAGHMLPLEQPAALAMALGAWLKEL